MQMAYLNGHFSERLAPCSETYWFANDFPNHVNGPENYVFRAVLRKSFSNATIRKLSEPSSAPFQKLEAIDYSM